MEKSRRCYKSLLLVLSLLSAASGVCYGFSRKGPGIADVRSSRVWNLTGTVELDGKDEYYFLARNYIPSIPRFDRHDPKAEKYYSVSPSLPFAGNPVNAVDPDGEEWKYINEDPDNSFGKFEWIDPKLSYDENGQLLPDIYTQAISFSSSGPKGKFNPDSYENIGTSIATVYKADGTTEEFEACTYPSDPEKSATVPNGRYEAKVGKHNVSSSNGYPALRMGNVGTKNFYANSIDLGYNNPSKLGKNSSSPNTAEGINIHKPTQKNNTKADNQIISAGCFLIDYNRWNEFIKIFDNPKQKDKTIGIIVL